MSEFSSMIQEADWKVEKHAPVIEAPESVKAGEFFTVTAGLGKAIAHPNTAQHHISWISLYFLPEGGKQAIQLAHAEFSGARASSWRSRVPCRRSPTAISTGSGNPPGKSKSKRNDFQSACMRPGSGSSCFPSAYFFARGARMKATIRTFDSVFLDSLAAEAAEAPRRRKNANIHAANDDPCHRLFNAMQADTYVQPHCHAAAEKDETVVLLRGKLGLVEFDGTGQVVAAATLVPGMTVDIPHGTFHGWCCLEDGSIFFEAKAGPYAPLTEAEKASFAPAEGDPKVPEYLEWLKSICTAS